MTADAGDIAGIVIAVGQIQHIAHAAAGDTAPLYLLQAPRPRLVGVGDMATVAALIQA